MHHKIKTFLVPLLTVVILVLMIMWLAGAFDKKIKPDEITAKATYTGKTLTLALNPMAMHEAVSATVRSSQSTDIAARILAPIKAIHVKAGDMVNQGDVLIELDNRDMRANTAQARANINAINARMLEAKSNFLRTKNLYDKESATKADYEKASANYASLKAQLASAKQMLKASTTTQSYSEITAPFSARVTNHYAEAGDLASPGMKLLTLYNPQALRIDAHVRESLALSLKPGQTLQTFIAALNINIPATINEIVPAADPGSRSFLIKAKVEPHPQLLPGMFAKIQIPTGEQQQLLVPANYIQQVGQLEMVWVLQNSIPVRRFIRIGQQYDDQVVIVSGLSPGEKLVRLDNSLTSGLPVNELEKAFP